MMISLFVSVTLIPMLAALKAKVAHDGVTSIRSRRRRRRTGCNSNRPRLDGGRFLLLPVWAVLGLVARADVRAALDLVLLAVVLRRAFRVLGRVFGIVLNPLARLTMGFFDYSLRGLRPAAAAVAAGIRA